MTLFLVDASHYQSALPVSSLRGQGFVGLVAKATQGHTYTDPSFADFMAQAKQAGLLFAAYHYLEPGAEVAQAAHTAAVVPADVPVWIDVEGASTRDQAYVYARALRAQGRTVAGIYNASQPSPELGWWRAAYGIDPTGSASYAYTANGGDASPRWNAGTIRHPQIWQFCQHGRIQGFTGDVDLNAYRGTLDELVATGWFWVPAALRPQEDPLAVPDQEALDAIASAVLHKLTTTAVVADTEPDPQLAGRTLPGLALQAARRAGMAATAAAAAATRALPGAVDEAQLAATLAPLLAQLLPAQVQHLSADDLQAVARAVADEEARRLGGGA